MTALDDRAHAIARQLHAASVAAAQLADARDQTGSASPVDQDAAVAISGEAGPADAKPNDSRSGQPSPPVRKGHAMTTLTRPDTTPVEAGPVFSFLWLEITGRCGLSCSHCYAGSGPAGSHGTMTAGDWRSVITQAAGLGVSMVQFKRR